MNEPPQLWAAVKPWTTERRAKLEKNDGATQFAGRGYFIGRDMPEKRNQSTAGQSMVD